MADSVEPTTERLAVEIEAANAMRTGLTAAEFEAAYAARSGTTVDRLHSWDRFAEPCYCDDAICEGWAMGRQWTDAIEEDTLR